MQKRDVFSEIKEGFYALAQSDLFDQVERALGSREKAAAWFDARNPLLGDVTPRDMILAGRTDQLRKFVQASFTLKGAPD